MEGTTGGRISFTQSLLLGSLLAFLAALAAAGDIWWSGQGEMALERCYPTPGTVWDGVDDAERSEFADFRCELDEFRSFPPARLIRVYGVDLAAPPGEGLSEENVVAEEAHPAGWLYLFIPVLFFSPLLYYWLFRRSEN